MKSIIRYAVGTVLLLYGTAGTIHAQPVEMADTLRAEGKIYVIVGIILIVLAGLVAYLFLLDRKVSRIEKELKK